MKFKALAGSLLLIASSSAFAGTYTCDIELNDGSKTTMRDISADSESEAASVARESNSEIKYVNCFQVD